MKWKEFLKRAGVMSLTAVVATSAMSLPAFAAEKSDPQYIDKYFEVSGTSSFIKEHRDIINTVAEGMFRHETEIDISQYKIAYTSENAKAIFEGTLAAYPEIFFVGNSYGRSGIVIDGNTIISTINVTYSEEYSESEIKTMLSAFYEEADFYLNQVQNELSVCTDDFSRAMLLHDEIVLDAQYVLEKTNYDFMVNKQGRCENYARVYAYLLGQLGIYSELIDSKSMNHEWVKIKLDGEYYNVDVTWDDPTPDHPGRVGHDYFLLSDSKIQTSINQGQPHTNYVSINSSDDTKYDDYAYHGFNSKLCKLESDKTEVYAIDKTKGIVKYNYDTNTTTDVLDITDKWSVLDMPGYTWNDKYSGLDTFDGLLYYNTPNAIYSFNPETNDTEKVYTKSSDKKDLYGLRIKNGELYGVFADSPNDPGESEQLITLKKDFSDGVGERLAGYSLSLEGNIGVNFYMELDESVVNNENAYMLFTLPDGATQTVKVSDATKDTKTTNGTTYYVFRCDVAAKRMTDTITAQIIVDETAKGNKYEYTVKEYADYLLNNKDKNEKYAKAAELVQSMLNYGAYSQKYFNYNLDNLANKGAESTESESVTAANINKAYDDTTALLPDGMTFYGANLELESETTLNLYFTNTTGQTLTFTDSKENVLDQKPYGEGIQVVIPNIAAQNLDDDFTVNVSVGGTTGYYVQYSPLTYCYNVLERPQDKVRTDALRALVKALYIYNTKANEYFGSLT